MAKLEITISALFGGVKNAVNQTVSSIKGMGKSINGAMSAPFSIMGGLGIGAGLSMKQMVSDIASIGEESQKMGVTTDEFQKLSFMAEQSGTDVETVKNAFNKLQKAVDGASTGNAGLAETFSRLGLSAENFIGKSPDEAFNMVADGLSRIDSEGQKSALAMALFGKSGNELRPMIENIKALGEEFEKMGGTISKDVIDSADKMDDWSKKVVTIVKATQADILEFWKNAFTGKIILDPTNQGDKNDAENAKKKKAEERKIADLARIHQAKDKESAKEREKKDKEEAAQWLKDEDRRSDKALENADKYAERWQSKKNASENVDKEYRDMEQRIKEVDTRFSLGGRGPATNDMQQMGALMGNQSAWNPDVDRQVSALEKIEQNTREINKIKADFALKDI
jgi:hypothetical protein